MSGTDKAGAAATPVPGPPHKSSQHKDRLSDTGGKTATRHGRRTIDDEAALVGRENSAMAREDAAHEREDAVTSREDAAHLREGAATSREGEIRVAQALQAASDEHMLVLQQSNTQLVIATVEAQKLSEQLEAARAQLERAKSVAEKANLAKSEFLSNMSHELRTPLNAILGFAQLLEAGSPPPTPSQGAKIGQILQGGWYLLKLINEILDLATIEAGKLAVSQESVPVAAVMHECQAMIKPQAQQRDIHVTFVPFDNSWFVNADRTRLKQVLINLLANAIKYNREHGTVEVKCRLSTPERIRISVKDSGIGLSAENLAHLFQPFNRLGQEDGGEAGTGIGLVVTKKLVELMGGTIGVESTVGVGSEFWIELVRDAVPELAAANPMSAESAPQVQENAAPRTLLYVEDNPSNLMLVAQIMEGHPHIRMLSASDGNLGLALARAHRPDVILLDINLRGISGFEVLKALRADPVTAGIPTLAISANAMPRDIEKGLEAGFLRYITKPIKVAEFMAALNMALE